MRFISTRAEGASAAPAVDLATAVQRGLAADGGLYMPETLPPLPDSWWRALPGRPLVETATALLSPFLDALPESERRELIADALDFPLPLVELEPGVWVLELFHGPTLAFKDVGARFLARLLGRFSRPGDAPLTVLVATSGDTGGAVAQAFYRVPGTRVVVLYPRGKVSALQEAQFTTLGDNVEALAVDGVFDDCQRLVKEAFADPELRRTLNLTSANSINIGRLLPQMVYYAHALSQLPAAGPPPWFSTPSGNFGNLAAGLMARRLGLPCSGFVAATNANDVVPEYLSTGRYRPRPSIETLSSAMDVGEPSNLDRILHLYDGDLDALRRDLRGSRHSDEETRRAILDLEGRHGYLADPHTAVGYLGWCRVREQLRQPARGVVLSTAHPVKFRDQVEPLIGRPLELPDRLARCLEHPPRVQSLAVDFHTFKRRLLETSVG